MIEKGVANLMAVPLYIQPERAKFISLNSLSIQKQQQPLVLMETIDLDTV